MQVREFKESDRKSLFRWLERHGHPTDVALPAYGIIVPGVAAGFLRHAEGGVAILEGFCTNPLVSGHSRHRALESIYKHFLSLPYHTFLGWTSDKSVGARGSYHGFKPMQVQLFARRQ